MLAAMEVKYAKHKNEQSSSGSNDDWEAETTTSLPLLLLNGNRKKVRSL